MLRKVAALEVENCEMAGKMAGMEALLRERDMVKRGAGTSLPALFSPLLGATVCVPHSTVAPSVGVVHPQELYNVLCGLSLYEPFLFLLRSEVCSLSKAGRAWFGGSAQTESSHHGPGGC